MSTEEHPPDEAIFIENAGLVILAPFLPRYFTLLNRIPEGAFIGQGQAIRGAQLLQYAATGQTEHPEHLLVLNKILCGISPSTPLPLSIDLTEEEKTVTDQLLHAVLQNWDKMSNSSVENLRGSFLLRSGLLIESEGHWTLRIESAGYDVLLRFLPWTISVVQLPWMENDIAVDWNTQMT
jgi:hypothetical protein